jgi:NDP-sugar pyrophosphorylase family protein
MGSLGQKLPKVLWPVFEKSLLHLQVAYARSLGIPNVYINLHHMGEAIEAHCKGEPLFEHVRFLWERPDILDIGGAIHNLASLPEVGYKGKLLVLNADQFFYMEKKDLYRFLEPWEKHTAALFSYKVDAALGYNGLEIGHDRFIKNIIKNQDFVSKEIIETYTGISFIDLSRLSRTEGRSAFFESVCTYKEKKIPAILLKDIEYWDFGTLRRYWETCHRLIATYRTHATHPFIRFLVQEKALKTWKIDLQKMSYHAISPRVINLGTNPMIEHLHPTIIFEGDCTQDGSEPMIWWRGHAAEVK